jgi:hypothetical protein
MKAILLLPVSMMINSYFAVGAILLFAGKVKANVSDALQATKTPATSTQPAI